ncbi:DMT family transporter [Abyssibius alkaniclasticus]|uniref:EamA family transporter n=1 Tax=Abyssibius alkaniclasticus TaxID=2881234 RepID=UPI0023635C9F|nr:EamA family transporter [Abyssibius alkaniclasticus]UPH70078.1 DMT family transporter [Abyssibius alkaniclasticus]
MTEWLLSIEGTETGRLLAMGLALLAAFSHAVFGALQKGRFDPWLTRGAIDANYALMAAPFALFVVPWPEPHMWPIFAGMMVIHIGYKLLQAMAYERGAYTVVYPVVRGTGPLITVIAAGIVFGEHFSALQWLGVLALSGGIFGLAAFNLTRVNIDPARLRAAIALAFATGIFVAIYTTYDAYGIRATANPFTFLAWFFFLDGLIFPLLALRRFRAMSNRPNLGALLKRGFIGGLIAYISFGSVMMATRLDKVGEAAVLRETSTVIAALIGWLVLKETVGWTRGLLMAGIALGAIIVEFGG